MKYVLLAETGADIPENLRERYHIYIAPMHVTFGSTTRDDGSFPIEEVFQYYKTSGELPRTSGCNVGDFETVLTAIRQEHPESHILYFAYSAVTTCSYQSCAIASEQDPGITLFDTRQVSAGQCLFIILMARYLEKNPDAELSDILKTAEMYRDRCHMGFFPGDLDYLRAGGRVSNIAYLGAKILSLNPLIELIDGKLMASRKYRGSMEKTGLKLLSDFADKYQLSREILYFPYSHGLSDSTRQKLTEKARSMGFQEILWVQTGSVVSTHSGPGAFGVAGISELN